MLKSLGGWREKDNWERMSSHHWGCKRARWQRVAWRRGGLGVGTWSSPRASRLNVKWDQTRRVVPTGQDGAFHVVSTLPSARHSSWFWWPVLGGAIGDHHWRTLGPEVSINEQVREWMNRTKNLLLEMLTRVTVEWKTDAQQADVCTVSAAWGHLDRLAQTTETESLALLKTWKSGISLPGLKSGCWQGWFLLETPREKLFHACRMSPGLHGCWPSWARGRITVGSASGELLPCVFTWASYTDPSHWL